MLEPEAEVRPSSSSPRRTRSWRSLKGARASSSTRLGRHLPLHRGSAAVPGPVDRPARTMLTGEGGMSPSRFKHLETPGGRIRRLTPVELERINGFAVGWTAGMSDGKRAFCMGNALVVGLVERRPRRPRTGRGDTQGLGCLT